MLQKRGRAFRVLALAAVAVAGASLAPSGYRFVEYAEAATRSTSQFRASPIDPRVAYEPGAETMARSVALALPDAVATVEQHQNGPFVVPVRVYVCATVESFARYGANPRAGGFTADHRLFLSPKPENTAERIPRVLTHELSHLHLGARRGALSFARLPVWFVEGWRSRCRGAAAPKGSPTRRSAGRSPRAIRSFPRPKRASFHPKGARAYGLDAHMFYGQAGMFVGHLQSLDARRFETFVRSVEEGDALGNAFEAAFGISIEIAWRRFVDEAKAATSPLPEAPRP